MKGRDWAWLFYAVTITAWLATMVWLIFGASRAVGAL